MTNLTNGKVNNLGYEPEPLEKTLKSVTGYLKIVGFGSIKKSIIKTVIKKNRWKLFLLKLIKDYGDQHRLESFPHYAY